MAGIEEFRIDFTEDKTYLEGENVRGWVIVQLKQDTVIELLEVEFTGVASVDVPPKKATRRLSDPLTKHRKPVRHSFRTSDEEGIQTECTQKEKYLNQRVTLYARDGGSHFMVKAGRHRYPFSFQLPNQVPTSFEGRYGSIKYYCRAHLYQPWHPKHTAVQQFKIKSQVDLTEHTIACKPLRRDCRMTYRVGTMTCVNFFGSVIARWRIDRLGFLPREFILIRGRVCNYSVLAVSKSKAELWQFIRYNLKDGRTHVDKRKVTKVKRGSIPSGGKDTWREQLIIPDLPPTGLNGCELMDIWYILTLSVHGWPHLEKTSCATEIVIGSTVGESWNDSIVREFSRDDLDLPPIDENNIDTSYFV